MKTWDQVIKDALYYHVHADKYAYFYGAKGELLTLENIQRLIASSPDYFKKYSTEQMNAIISFSIGRVGFDCSGFISRVTGCNLWSGGIWSKCTEKTTPARGPAASILWLPGHVGLDIGYGYYLQTGREGESITLGRLSENVIKWEASGKLTGYIDYKGASER